jgi:hypothetical protein
MGVGLGVTVLSAALAVALYFAAENVKKKLIVRNF